MSSGRSCATETTTHFSAGGNASRVRLDELKHRQDDLRSKMPGSSCLTNVVRHTLKR
jgi:hypothetical protein